MRQSTERSVNNKESVRVAIAQNIDKTDRQVGVLTFLTLQGIVLEKEKDHEDDSFRIPVSKRLK